MTPKEKAEELFYKMSTNSSDEDHHCSHYVAKNCASVAVDEILNNCYTVMKPFWQEVKMEIDKL